MEGIGFSQIIQSLAVIHGAGGLCHADFFHFCQMVDDPKGFGLDEFFNDGKRYPFGGGHNYLSMFIYPQVDILHVFADEFVFNWNAFIFYGVQFHCKISLFQR